jgi:hypothetical protein
MCSFEFGGESFHSGLLLRRASLQSLASIGNRIEELAIVIADFHSIEDGALNFLRHGGFSPL